MMVRNFLSVRTSSRFGLFTTNTRNLFVVSLEYKVPLKKVDEHLSAHRNFLEECYKNNTFIASGKKEPRTGGIIIASAKDKETLESILIKDPFKQHDIANYEITEFIPTMCSNDFLKIAEEDKATIGHKRYGY